MAKSKQVLEQTPDWTYKDVYWDIQKKNISDLLERSNDYKDFTEEELAEISYNFPGRIDRWRCPQLYNSSWRIYTIDLPKKVIEYFDKTYEIDPNEYWYLNKLRVPFFEWFAARNWLSKSAHIKWRQTRELYAEACDIAMWLLIENVAGWALNMVYNSATATLILKNISDYSDKIQIEAVRTVKDRNQLDFSKMPYEQLVSLAQSETLVLKELKKVWWIQEEEPENNDN